MIKRSPTYKTQSTLVDGFTLTEVMFVMLLSSLIVTLVFTYYSQFTGYIYNITEQSSSEIELLRFESILTYDIDRSEVVHSKKNDLIFDIGDAEIIYEFYNSHILRIQENTADSIPLFDIYFYIDLFEGSKSLVEHIYIEGLDDKGHLRNYYFYKPYPVWFYNKYRD